MSNANINVIEGKLVADGIKVGIVASRFNEFIVSKLIGGALDGLLRHDVKEEDITLAWVPGAFELPLTAQKMAKSGKYDAVICLGAVIRVRLLIMIWYATKRQKVSRRWVCRLAFRLCSAWLPQRISSRRSNARELRRAIRDMTALFPLSKR